MRQFELYLLCAPLQQIMQFLRASLGLRDTERITTSMIQP